MSVVTRFAPSPTGFLHIGGARTALFNWLYARKMGGQYLLRIEDTDRARSTPEAIAAILDGLDWLGLQHDGEITYQYARAPRHREVAETMVARGAAFRCYVTQESLNLMRAGLEHDQANLRQLRLLLGKTNQTSLPTADDLAGVLAIWPGEVFPDPITWDFLQIKEAELAADLVKKGAGFRSPYRDGAPPPSPDAPFVVRLRAPDSGDVLNEDLIQGPVRIKAQDIDDLVLLRADGGPTYMLSVVVDDHDMGVTHVIRGDDHLTNAARQIPIYRAMDWTPPKFAHVSLIHGDDGAKLSKRHGAPEVQSYRTMGYLPEAMNAYLMRLGWSPGHDDLLTKEDAVPQFDLAQIGKAPARLDLKKLASVNAHFMALADDGRIAALLVAETEKSTALDAAQRTLLTRAAPVLKKRARTIVELADQARFLLAKRPLTLDDTAKSLMKDDFKQRLKRLHDHLAAEPQWDHAALASALKAFATQEGVGLGQIGPGLRAALSGGAPAPDLGQALELLGRDEALARIADQV